jgi:hypothetical protein
VRLEVGTLPYTIPEHFVSHHSGHERLAEYTLGGNVKVTDKQSFCVLHAEKCATLL